MINLSCASAGGSVAGWDPVGHHILVRFTQQSFPVPWSVAALERGTLLGALSSTDSLENLSLAIFSGSIAVWGVTGPVVIDALTLLNKLFGAFADCSVAAWDVPGRDAVAGLIRSPDLRLCCRAYCALSRRWALGATSSTVLAACVASALDGGT